MDIWEGGLDRNVDTGDLVINLAVGKRGETNSCQFFSITLQTITLNPNTYIIDHHQHESDTVSKGGIKKGPFS